jgi:hypothetical protein
MKFYFENFDSPEGKTGQLNYARGWEERDEEWRKNMLNDESSPYEENKKMMK